VVTGITDFRQDFDNLDGEENPEHMRAR
jgi:hypothetical protein